MSIAAIFSISSMADSRISPAALFISRCSEIMALEMAFIRRM